MTDIQAIDSFNVKQQKQFGGIADRFGREFTNQYAVFAPDDSELFVAAEHVKDLNKEAIRSLYKKHRPFEIEIHDGNDNLILRVVRKTPHKYFHSVDIFDPQNRKIATLKRLLKFSQRLYSLDAVDFPGNLSITGSLLDPYRFQITQEEKRIGEIKKVREGMFKKGNKCDDQFIVAFSSSLDPRLKLTFLGAVFLIDFVYFEK